MTEVDTSDIPEADEDWFKRARLILPKKTRRWSQETIELIVALTLYYASITVITLILIH